MATTSITSQGTTISIGGTTVTQATDITSPSGGISEIDISNLSSVDDKEYATGLNDRGEMSFSWIVDSAPIEEDSTIVACSINGVGWTIAFMGYVKSAPVKVSTDGVVTQDVTVRVTGSV